MIIQCRIESILNDRDIELRHIQIIIITERHRVINNAVLPSPRYQVYFVYIQERNFKNKNQIKVGIILKSVTKIGHNQIMEEMKSLCSTVHQENLH